MSAGLGPPNVSNFETLSPILNTVGSHFHITVNHGKVRELIGFLFPLAWVQKAVSCVITDHIKLDCECQCQEESPSAVHRKHRYPKDEEYDSDSAQRTWLPALGKAQYCKTGTQYLDCDGGIIQHSLAWDTMVHQTLVRTQELARPLGGSLPVTSGRKPKADAVLGFGWEIHGTLELVSTAVTWNQIMVPLRLVLWCVTPWNGQLQIEC